MNIRWRNSCATERGSVLIIVLWVALGLVAITLYFANSMTLELRASDNRVAAIEAEQAIEGASRYACYVISNSFFTYPGVVPDPTTYQCEAVPLGDAHFWFIGRGEEQSGVIASRDTPYFSLVDECSKLNLNTATLEMLQMLPYITPEIAAAIIDWRDEDSEVTSGGAETDVYQRFQQPYACKNLPFETVDELRLVFGASTQTLFGEDANLNGVLDINENDGNISLPDDNRDGRIDRGLFEFVTIYSLEPATRSDGMTRTNINDRPALTALLQTVFNQERANDIMAQAGGGQFSSLLDFFIRSRMTADEFTQIEPDIRGFADNYATGLVNVAAAPAEVLACIPGIGTDFAASMVNYRQSNPSRLNSISWVAEVLEGTNATAAGPWITSRSYQYSADVAAVGHHGRGYRRTRYVLDMSTGVPKTVHRQDLTHLGWALGINARRMLLTRNSQNSR